MKTPIKVLVVAALIITVYAAIALNQGRNSAGGNDGATTGVTTELEVTFAGSGN